MEFHKKVTMVRGLRDGCMKEERTDGLERRVVGQSTTERVLITLYEVVEKGCNIAHDSPAIGCWETYGCWERTHGPYRRRTDAERKAAEVQMA